MVSTAQITYPESEIELDDSGYVEVEDDYSDALDNGDDLHGAPPGREFSVSYEDFCAESYSHPDTRYERQELGKRGEDAAARYLKAKGYEIIKRNWFCKFGEADIIARDEDGTLCFIEVKTRQSVEAGIPEESITVDKQKRYERIALCYMVVSDDWDDNDLIRFDAIGICVTSPHKALLRHHKGCFNGCI